MGVKLEDLIKENNNNNNNGKVLEDKSKKTIRLLLIIISFIILLIIIFAAATVSKNSKNAQIERATNLAADIDAISLAVKNIYAEYRIDGDESKLIGYSQEDRNAKPYVLNGEEYKHGYFYISPDEIKNIVSTLRIEDEAYLVNYSTGDAVNLIGAEWNNKKYYTVDDLKAIKNGQTPPSDYTIVIDSPEDMQYLHEYPNGYFKLSKDIDMISYSDGDGWKPVPEFSGTFNGRGYVIKNLYISRTSSDYCGLFGRITNSANITNLKLEKVNVSGGNYVGAIAGACSGNLSNCTISGNVTSTFSCVGGAVGLFENGVISNVVSTVNVNGNENVGGFVGTMTSGTIQTSSAQASINGSKNVGGFVGRVNPAGNSLIEQVYANTSISSVENSGGMLGTVEMQNASSFKIADSYSKGQITFGNMSLGGFVGSIKANTNTNFVFSHCYTTVKTPTECSLRGGFAGDITTASGGEALRCYWEKDNRYGDYELPGIGKTNNEGVDFEDLSPEQMKDASNYGTWDIEKVWKIVPGNTPVLRWQ